MAEATGLSAGYCSFVRRGQKVPHRRHWWALAALGEDPAGQGVAANSVAMPNEAIGLPGRAAFTGERPS